MLKSIQFKIIIIFTLVGVITIAALGTTYVRNLKNISSDISARVSIEDISTIVNSEIGQAKIMTMSFMIVFVLLMIIIGALVLKVVVAPLANLVKSAEQATKGKLLGDGKKKNEISDLVNAFNSMNEELKDNLNEATRQTKQMETILLHMNDGIIAFNMDGDVIHINPAAKEFMNLKDEKTFDEIFSKYEDVDINLEKIIYLENITTTEKILSIEDRTLNLFFAAFKNENDRPGGLIVIIQNITERERLDSMRKRFVADVSHELKTPITSILGYSDTLLENDVDPETSKKFLERISSEAERMARLVSDLLVLSRYDTSKVKVEKSEFDLGELVKYTFDGLDIEMKKKNHTGECYVTSNVPTVYADKSGIQRVVLNILTNAIKYTPENGNIKVYVGCVYNDAYIKIIDNGIGIPKEDLDKIYERFYRVDKARTREMGGTGLGLSIAKEILDQNGGMMNINSEYGKGTEVVIRIPTKQTNYEKNIKEEKTFEEVTQKVGVDNTKE